MTSIQSAVADVLDAALNIEPDEPRGYIVRPYPWAPNGAEPDKTYVSVYRTVTEPAANRQGARRHELHVAVMSSHQDPARADEALDVALDAVLDVLDTDDQLRGLAWSEARRTVIADTYPAFDVTSEVYTTTTPEGS